MAGNTFQKIGAFLDVFVDDFGDELHGFAKDIFGEGGENGSEGKKTGSGCGSGSCGCGSSKGSKSPWSRSFDSRRDVAEALGSVAGLASTLFSVFGERGDSSAETNDKPRAADEKSPVHQRWLSLLPVTQNDQAGLFSALDIFRSLHFRAEFSEEVREELRVLSAQGSAVAEKLHQQLWLMESAQAENFWLEEKDILRLVANSTPNFWLGKLEEFGVHFSLDKATLQGILEKSVGIGDPAVSQKVFQFVSQLGA